MSHIPYMQFYPEKYLADDRLSDFTTEQHGAYLLLLMHMWNRGGKLLDDDTRLAKLAKLSKRKWSTYREVLIHNVASDEIVDTDTQLQPMYSYVDPETGRRFVTQKRLRAEYEKSASLLEKKREGGRRGGRSPKGVLEESLSTPQGEDEDSPSTLEGVVGKRIDKSRREEIRVEEKEIPGDPGGSPGEKDTSSAGRPPPAYPVEFEQFWSQYPRKREKPAAYKAWQSRRKEGTSADDLIAAARWYAEATRKTDTQFIKHPKTFLGTNKPFAEWVDGIPEGERNDGNTGSRVGSDAEWPNAEFSLDRIVLRGDA